MNINTTAVINSIKNDIQNKIDMEQKRLNDINNALRMAEDFLLDNGSEDISQDDDVLKKVMITIKELKEKIKINNKDIESIQQSIQALSNISNKLDDSVLSSLNSKIEDIKNDIEYITNKLNSTNKFLPILLNLQIICPICKGSCNIKNNDKEGFSNTHTHSICSYCEGIGVLSIGKVLQNENLLEEEVYEKYNKFEANQSVENKNIFDKRKNDHLIQNNIYSSFSKYTIKRNK